MFTNKAQIIIDTAKDLAYSNGSPYLDTKALLTSLVLNPETKILLTDCTGLDEFKLKSFCLDVPELISCPGKLSLTETVHDILNQAKEVAQKIPDPTHPGFISIRHIVSSLVTNEKVCSLLEIDPLTQEESESKLASWLKADYNSPHLDELTARVKKMRNKLLLKVYGQDHAINAFVEGIFNSEVVAYADTERKAPRALFVFAGPPGVGKTFLAETASSYLERPFKRFDMSSYSEHHQSDALIGLAKSYKGAKPGILTEFVEKNPDSILLFDEIEKAHINTILLFLQILDAGILEDKYHERNVIFKDTTIIFTTNAGSKLYDRPNISGISSTNALFHRKTLINALENEKDPQTGRPFFPPAICSRLSTGYPVLFNHLKIKELVRIVDTEMKRFANLFEKQYFKRLEYHELLPIFLILREGVKVDARTLRSQTEIFIKTEIFKFSQLFKSENLERVLSKINKIRIDIDENAEVSEGENLIMNPDGKPLILLIASDTVSEFVKVNIDGIEWVSTDSPQDALNFLGNKEFDLILLDLWIGNTASISLKTIQGFDHAPVSSQRFKAGQELLRTINTRFSGTPVYILSNQNEENVDQPGLEEELYRACILGGGARGVINSRLIDITQSNWEVNRNKLQDELLSTCRSLFWEKTADKMGREHKIIAFETAPKIEEKSSNLIIRIRNTRLSTAIAASDVGEVLEDVERPQTRFEDVIGANSAKDELQFFIDYLKKPKRFIALGLKPPKGVLLYGPPGTGKTMLARAMAGESNVAFISASASSFVTVWQGSGPQNIRDLFERARRYAPSIIFIDEIDAIGRTRTGSAGGAQATENTLNALLTEMDGFTSPSPDRPVFILAATNFKVGSDNQGSPEQSSRTLDPALVRRFSRTILIDFPDKADRLKYLKMRLGKRAGNNISEEKMKLIAVRSSGMSIANLELIIETAARNAAKRGNYITDKDLEDAFETVSFGEKKTWDSETVKRTARHEVGHTIMYWMSGYWPSYVTIVSRGNFGGYMESSSEGTDKEFGQNKEQILADIRVSLGGRGAELFYYGNENGLTTGAFSDLKKATNMARAMICLYGMDEEFGPLVIPELLQSESAIGSPDFHLVNQKIRVILKEQMEMTLQSLKENANYLEAVTNALIDKEKLTVAELKEILPDIYNKRIE
jgi:cell division protease FtsH